MHRFFRVPAVTPRIMQWRATIPSHQRAPLPVTPFQTMVGNRAMGRTLQAKLMISQPGDPYELEADRIADQVMRTPEPSVQRACECGGTCDACKAEEEPHLHRAPARTVTAASLASAAVPDSVAGVLRSPGEPLDTATRDYMQPRLGADLRTVRVHHDHSAAASAHDVQALAYTVGNHIVFGSGQYAPGTNAGRRLITHELVHTLQQQGATARPMIARVSAAMCSTDCAAADGGGGPSGQYLLTIHADREGPFLLMPLTSKVGHSWVQLTDDTGNAWTYGFWPKTGFDPAHLASDVDGCVHHPDTAHRPSASRTFTLTAAQFAAAKARAVATCATPPKYNLFGLQCTEFVRQILEAAGQAPALGFGLIWESPNALNTWIRGHSLMLGASVPAAASGSGATGFGATTAELSYRYQFYALLGEKVRLSLLARGDLGKYQQTVSTGLGVDLTANRVFLPRIYLFGGGIAGGLPSALPGATGSKLGAGVTAGGGLAFDIDQLATVGIEYSVVKDIVSNDPDVHRLMISAKIPLF